jgi:hypothetical protein
MGDKATDIDGAALKAKYISAFRVAFQKEVAAATLAPF